MKKHIPPNKEIWRGKSLEYRQKWTDDFYILYPKIKKLGVDFEQKLEYCERSHKHETMFVTGGTGAGKSTLTQWLKAFANERYQRFDEEKTICPVIQFAIPTPCTPTELSLSVLRALGEANPKAKRSQQQIKDAAEEFLKTCEVKLVLIDNIQDVPARRGKRGIEKIGERLRELIDHSEALWVLLGTKDAKKVINSDDQLIRRAAYQVHLPYFNIDTELEKASFKKLLAKIDEWLPVAEKSCLNDAALAMSMFIATEGIFDRIVRLVDRAWIEAVQSNREKILKQDFENAFVYVYGMDAKECNPFHEAFTIRPLQGVNEPFEYLRGAIFVDTAS